MGNPPPSDSFAIELARAIDSRGLALDRICAHLRARGHHISAATISYWRSGRSRPTRERSWLAIGSLEEILGIPRGSLACRISPPPVRSAPHPAGLPPVTLAPQATQLQLSRQFAAEMGLTWGEGIELLSIHVIATVDTRLMVVESSCREVLRTVGDGVTTHLVGAGHPMAGRPPSVTALHGCRNGRRRGCRDESLCVQELLLPPEPAGTVHVLDYLVRYDAPPPTGPLTMSCLLSSTAPIPEMYVEVHFPASVTSAPTTTPTTPTPITVTEGTAAGTITEERRMAPVMSLHRRFFGPGHIGFSWQAQRLSSP